MSPRGGSEARVFAALGDPTRRRVLDLLAERGEGTATELAAQVPVSRPAVVKHLGVLAGAGLVERRRLGREVRFRVRPEPLAEAGAGLARIAREWDARLGRLRDLAEAAERDPGGR